VDGGGLFSLSLSLYDDDGMLGWEGGRERFLRGVELMRFFNTEHSMHALIMMNINYAET